MDNPVKTGNIGTQDEEKQNKNTICVGHHYAQTNTNIRPFGFLAHYDF